MAIQTKRTMTDWALASAALGHEISAQIIAAVSKQATLQGASADTEADALPHTFLAVWRNGADIDSAACKAVQSKHRTMLAKQNGDDSQSLDAAVTEADRDALSVAIIAAGLGRSDRSGRINGHSLSSGEGGDRGALMPLTEALALARQDDRVLITAVLTEAATRPLHKDYDGARFMPLKVSVVAAARGHKRPTTAARSNDERMAACGAAGRIMAAMEHAPESAMALAESAMAYVTRDRTGAHGQAVWQGWARPTVAADLGYGASYNVEIPYSAYRPTRAFLPDMYVSEDGVTATLAPLQRISGHKRGMSGKGRKGSPAGQTAFGVAAGAGAGASTPESNDTLSGQYRRAFPVTPGNLAAKRATALVDADDRARTADDQRMHGAPCPNYVTDFYVSRLWLQTGTTAHTCACGPLAGTPLVLTRVRSAALWTGETRPVLTHALTVCSAPVVSAGAPFTDAQGRQHDGSAMTGTVRCGCGGKRGVLTPSGEHARRIR